MPIFEDSRYGEATILQFVREETNASTGEQETVWSETYIDDDRTDWKLEDFESSELQSVVANEGETADRMANRLWERSDLAWIVGQFYDPVGFDMFLVFEGTERLTLPTRQAVMLKILKNEDQL